MRTWSVVGMAGALAMAAGAVAQPYFSFVHTGLSNVQDISQDGNTFAAPVYDAGINEYVIQKYVRGVGTSTLAGAFWEGGNVTLSSDGSVVGLGEAGNFSDWHSLNCFNGTNPPLTPPCAVRNLGHRYASGTWSHIGGYDQVEFPLGSGNFFDQTRCDSIINDAWDISGDGRYQVGGGYIDVVAPFGGICGRFRAFRYDSVTGSFAMLPSGGDSFDVGGAILTSGTTRADYVNGDGTVIVGYETSSRRLCVWTWNGGPDVNGNADFSQTILDTGGYRNSIPTRDGTAIVGSIQGTFDLIKWTGSGTTWTPTVLGSFPSTHPTLGGSLCNIAVLGVSDDANTAVGIVGYSSGGPCVGGVPFIWKPSINSGVPMFLNDYLATIDNPSDPILGSGFSFGQPIGLSGDGNAILINATDDRNTCAPGLPVSHVTGTTGVIYLTGVACELPRIGMPPKDNVVTNYTGFGVSLNCFASGSGPLNYQWQHETSPGTWTDCPESCNGFDSVTFWEYEGTHKSQLRIGMSEGGGDRGGRYRCIITNDCGSVTSDPATVTFVTGACDFGGGFCTIELANRCATLGGVYQGNGTTCGGPVCVADVDDGTGTGTPDGGVTIDDLLYYLSIFNQGLISADVDDGTGTGTQDGGVTIDDLLYYLARFNAGC
ncbi:MAG: GC-type dockerin domain-anchored protein [Phycisphaerales bacterium]